MGKPDQYIVFSLDECSYGMLLPSVDRVIHAAAITPLPQAPAIVSGVLNLEGRIIPVLNIRRRFHLPEKEIGLTDQLIIAHTRQRPVAILVDAVAGVTEHSSEQIVPPAQITPNTNYLAGVIKLPDGMILIHDLDTFLSLDEENSLNSALASGRGTP